MSDSRTTCHRDMVREVAVEMLRREKLPPDLQIVFSNSVRSAAVIGARHASIIKLNLLGLSPRQISEASGWAKTTVYRAIRSMGADIPRCSRCGAAGHLRTNCPKPALIRIGEFTCTCRTRRRLLATEAVVSPCAWHAEYRRIHRGTTKAVTT